MTKIVDSLYNDHIFHAGLGNNVAMKPCQSIHAEFDIGRRIVENAIASDARIQNSEFVVGAPPEQSIRKKVRPAMIRVDGGTSSVRNRVTEGDNRRCWLRSQNINTAQ